MRVVAGHLVHHCGLCPPALSALDLVFGFAREAEGRYMRFSPGLRSELRVLKGLVFLCATDLAKPLGRVAFSSDSSMHGYALHETLCHPFEVLEEI